MSDDVAALVQLASLHQCLLAGMLSHRFKQRRRAGDDLRPRLAEVDAVLAQIAQQLRSHHGVLASALALPQPVLRFVGTSANAVLIQIWTALIAMLLLNYLMLRAKFAWSFANLLTMLRLQLFVYCELPLWLDQPFRAPPTPVGLRYQQLGLPFASA